MILPSNQKTYEIESIEQLKAFAEEIEKDVAKYKKAIMLLSSADGIALSTPEHTLSFSYRHHQPYCGR